MRVVKREGLGVEGKKTRITFALGRLHGVYQGTKGQIKNLPDGHFFIDNVTHDTSSGVVNHKPDDVLARINNVFLDVDASAKRYPH